MKSILLAVLTLNILLMTGCGKDNLEDKTQASSNGSQSSTLSNSYSCKAATHSFQGCCSHHNGIKSCGAEGNYQFSSNGQLVCNDGMLSPSCVY